MDQPVTRRGFLQSLGAAVVAAHLPGPSAVRAQTRAQRILACELRTAAALDAMDEFYRGRLGLRTMRSGSGRLEASCGSSTITFVHDPASPAPFYHFAFNIPENKIVAAREWQLERSPLIPIPARNHAAGFPADVVDYSHWNAHSIFFLDPGGNVVEYIARHDLRNAAPGPFGSQDILYTSEIALVVDDVLAAAATLRGALGLPNYRGGSADFMALGDEGGLVLVMRRGRIINFNPESREKAVSVFPTFVKLAGAPASLDLDGFPYRVRRG